MSDNLDLDRLAEIPDPFAGQARSPERRVSPAQMPHSPDRSRLRSFRVAAAVVAVLCDAAWVMWVERRPDMALVPFDRLAFGVAVPLAAGALAVSAVTRRGESGLGATNARVVALAMGSLAWFAAATWLISPAEPPDAHFWRHMAGCIAVTAALAAGPLTLAMLAFRRAFATASVVRAAALGVASGALAAATMTLVCPISSASHVILGHGVMMVIGGAVGAMLGRRVCRA